jgi:peptidoglycan/LPS O-acetylase OafA/YrhL
VTRSKQGYIPGLDGWRAIAIGAVLLSHSFPSTYWTRHGALGVNLFFAISGFLITTRLLEEHALTGRVSLKNFYIRRAFRILPPALTFLTVAAALAACGVIVSTRTDFVSALVFLRNYWGTDPQHGWYTAHFWSLAVEEHFYLFWPALLVLAGVRRSRFLAPALAIGFAAWRSLDMRHAFVPPFLHNEMRSDYRMDALLWGCTLALLAPLWNRRQSQAKAPLYMAVIPLVAAVVLNIYQPQGYEAAQAVLFPVVLALSVTHSTGFLEWAPLRWIGRLSYSLYLWQQLFFSHFHHGLLQRFPLNLALALSCACLSYYLIEKPLMRLGHRMTLYHKDRDGIEDHDARRIGSRVSTPPREGYCRPELSLTQPENGVS